MFYLFRTEQFMFHSEFKYIPKASTPSSSTTDSYTESDDTVNEPSHFNIAQKKDVKKLTTDRPEFPLYTE